MVGFEDEIQGQPQSLRDAVDFYTDPARGGDLLQQCREKFATGGYGQVIFTGMGSSYYDGLLGTYFLNSVGIPCRIMDSGEMANYFNLNVFQPYFSPLIIGISQSGESGEIIDLIRNLIAAGEESPTLWAITNNPESTLGKSAEICLPLMAGEENTVTSKTYICGLLVVWLLGNALSGVASILGDKLNDLEDLIDEIQILFQENQAVLEGFADKIDSFLGGFNHLHYIGQGTSLATVGQATLNLKELAKIQAEGMSIGMFRHGAQEIIDASFRAIITVSDPKAQKSAEKLIGKILESWGKGRVVLITNSLDSSLDYPGNKVLVIQNPVNNAYLAPIYEIVVLQGFMCRVTRNQGLVPGEFRFTQKVTL